MADTVTSQILIDGKRIAVMKFTNLSDGTGESAVTKVDVSALSPACDGVSISKIHYNTNGMSVTLLWDATADVPIVTLSGDGCLCCENFGGLWNNSGAGKTGDIKLTTNGHSSGDNYTIILELVKKYD